MLVGNFSWHGGQEAERERGEARMGNTAFPGQAHNELPDLTVPYLLTQISCNVPTIQSPSKGSYL